MPEQHDQHVKDAYEHMAAYWERVLREVERCEAAAGQR